MEGLRVLSLFDGISCGMVALERAGIQVKEYIAFEIEHNAIEISKKNYPSIIHEGDVTTADFTKYEGVDLIIGGSPCQNLSCAGNGEGLEGMASRLFYDFVRALYEAKPKWFMLENNATMTKENQDIITEIMGVEPIYINSNLVSAQECKRLYWTNIPGIEQPEDRKLFLKDIVQPKEEKQKYEIYKRMLAKKEGTLAHKKTWSQIRTLDQKSRALTTSQAISKSGATNVKYSETEYYTLTPLECERLQTLPDNYTEGFSDTQRYKVCGNGWTVEVIHHIFSYLRKAIEEGLEPIILKSRERPKQSYRTIVTEKNRAIVTEESEVKAMEKQNTESNEEVKKLKQEIEEKDKTIEKLKKEIEEIKIKMFDYLFKEKTA